MNKSHEFSPSSNLQTNESSLRRNRNKILATVATAAALGGGIFIGSALNGGDKETKPGNTPTATSTYNPNSQKTTTAPETSREKTSEQLEGEKVLSMSVKTAANLVPETLVEAQTINESGIFDKVLYPSAGFNEAYGGTRVEIFHSNELPDSQIIVDNTNPNGGEFKLTLNIDETDTSYLDSIDTPDEVMDLLSSGSTKDVGNIELTFISGGDYEIQTLSPDTNGNAIYTKVTNDISIEEVATADDLSDFDALMTKIVEG